MVTRKPREKDYESGGIGFIGSVLLGAGAGLLFDELLAGLLIGIGAGFIILAHFIRTQE